MDDSFIKRRADEIRDLASRADPFIKKRLLNLADRYDSQIGRAPKAIREIWSAQQPRDE
jgi:hypothetical protein